LAIAKFFNAKIIKEKEEILVEVHVSNLLNLTDLDEHPSVPLGLSF